MIAFFFPFKADVLLLEVASGKGVTLRNLHITYEPASSHVADTQMLYSSPHETEKHFVFVGFCAVGSDCCFQS